MQKKKTGFLENLKDNLANARAQVDELHVIGDRQHHVDHVVDELEACPAVHPGGERLIVVQLVRVADHIVVDLEENLFLWYETVLGGARLYWVVLDCTGRY